jgi:hypothetical protein
MDRNALARLHLMMMPRFRWVHFDAIDSLVIKCGYIFFITNRLISWLNNAKRNFVLKKYVGGINPRLVLIHENYLLQLIKACVIAGTERA